MVRITSDDYGRRLQHEIAVEADRVFKEKYGKRHPATISTQEWDDIITEASRIVMIRRRG